MASQRLETIIAINAKTGTGFSEVGSTLTELGSLISGVSNQLIEFGTDSVEVYRDYEKSMADAQVALSTTYGRNTAELSRVMDGLDEAATEWAASTIFHTNDVANAISEAAHAGWDYDQIMSGIPSAMELAQAGSLDLSDAVNYIVKTTNAAGIEFEDTGELIDQWAFTANSSATTIEELGDAMLKMGSTMKFAGGTEEFMTLIAATANAGVTGSEAGTMVRNAMLRLIAPTEKAEAAMEELGASGDEVASIMSDEALEEANEKLAAVGFSAYDSEGNLKNMVEIYEDLNTALSDIAGGAENIATNQEALDIVSAIFPTRTITEALALMNAAENDWYGIYDALEVGDAAGYGSYASETMMDTLDGRIETFESKVERLKQLVGEELSPQLSAVMDFFGGIADNISNLDDGAFSALVSGLEVIAAAGPGMLVGAGAMRAIGLLLTPGGAIAVGSIALVAAAAAMQSLAETNYENLFGTGEIDSEEIDSFLNGIEESYSTATAEIDAFKTALDESVTSYQTASAQFSSELLSKAITGTELTDADKEALSGLADSMYSAVIDSIENSAAGSMTYWEWLFGGEGTAESDVNYQNLIDLENESYQGLLAQAEEVGQNLKDAMLKAFSDGAISTEERSYIQGLLDSYNELIAQSEKDAQNAEDYANLQLMLHKAQSASYEEIKETSDQIVASTEAMLADNENNYIYEKAKAQYEYDTKIGRAETPEEVEQLTKERDAAFAATDAGFESKQTEIRESTAGSLLALWDTALQQSDVADAYGTLQSTAESLLRGRYTENGYTDLSAATDAYYNNTTWGERSAPLETIATAIESMGGYEAVSAMASDFRTSGATELASQLETLVAMYGIVGGSGEENLNVGDSLTGLRETIDTYASENPITFDVKVDGESITEGLEGVNYDPIPVNVTTDESGMQELQATIDGADGQELMEYVSGDATDLQMSITDLDGQTLRENVTGDASSLAAIINGYNGKTITVNIRGVKMFAEGGRATTASVFGEAGPEWAIPEEHSQRTAELLNAAREASGFTWPDLLSRFGGLNANASNQPSTIVYSPTIQAADATGVEQVLREDKSRLEKWFAEKKMFERVEVYA